MKKYLVLFLLLTACSEGYGGDVHLDNDFFLGPFGKNSDQYYTHSTRFGVSKETANEKQTYSIGSSIYTPSTKKPDADPMILEKDRPYTGYTYGEYRDSLRREDGILDTFGVSVGCVGKCSGAKWEQQTVHRLIGQGKPAWPNSDTEVSEPGFILEAEREKKLYAYRDAFDVSAGGVVGLGNIIDSAGVRLAIRGGYGLDTFASEPIVFKATRTDEKAPRLTSYLFGRVEQRAVGYNQLLEGSLFQSEPHTVTSKPFVNELDGGFTIGYGKYKFTYTLIRFSSEWKEKQTPFAFGSIDFSW